MLWLPSLTQWQMLCVVTGVATGERANLELRTLELGLAVNVVVPSGVCRRQMCDLWVSSLFLHDRIPKLNIYCFFFP